MGTDVIYEKPKLTILGKIRELWNNVTIHSEGFTEEYIKKMETKNGELQEGTEKDKGVHAERSQPEIKGKGGDSKRDTGSKNL